MYKYKTQHSWRIRYLFYVLYLLTHPPLSDHNINIIYSSNREENEVGTISLDFLSFFYSILYTNYIYKHENVCSLTSLKFMRKLYCLLKNMQL